MNSHVHLVVETAPDGSAVTPSGRRAPAAADEGATISKIMHDIALMYAKDFNFRHGRTAGEQRAGQAGGEGVGCELTDKTADGTGKIALRRAGSAVGSGEG